MAGLLSTTPSTAVKLRNPNDGVSTYLARLCYDAGTEHKTGRHRANGPPPTPERLVRMPKDRTQPTADICHCRHPRHYHRNAAGASPLYGDGIGACFAARCDCGGFQPIGGPVPPRSSDGLGIVHRALHGDGRRYYVVLGTQGFWILDSEESAPDGSPAVEAGVYASKSQARERCDRFNDGANH